MVFMRFPCQPNLASFYGTFMLATDFPPNILKELSVVIPAYKAEALVGRTISSLVDEGVPEENVIVVEDGCFDNTSNIVEGFSGVKFIRKPNNEGAPKARNEGLERVSTKYVMFLDSDDYVEGGLLFSLVEKLDSCDSDVAFGPWRYDGDNRNSGVVRQPPKISNEEWVFYWIHKSCVPPCAVVWRAESIRKAGGWDERLKKNQDGEIAVRCLMRGFKVEVSDKGCGVYWQHESAYRVSDASVKDTLYSANILYNNVLEWIRKEELMDSRTAEYLLGKYCCKQAWVAAEGKDYNEVNSWFDRSSQHGYTKKYYSKATKLASYFGVYLGAKVKAYVLSKTKRFVQA